METCKDCSYFMKYGNAKENGLCCKAAFKPIVGVNSEKCKHFLSVKNNHVYFEYYGHIEEGDILTQDKDVIKIQLDSCGTTHIQKSKIFYSYGACYAAYRKRREEIKKNYKQSIHTVEDLVKFMYENNVAYAEEYTDYEAREAAKEKAQELLGIEL